MNKLLLYCILFCALISISATPLLNPIQTDKQEYFMGESISITLNDIQGDSFIIKGPTHTYELLGAPKQTISFTPEEPGIYEIQVTTEKITQNKRIIVLKQITNQQNTQEIVDKPTPQEHISVGQDITWTITTQYNKKIEMHNDAKNIIIKNKNGKNIEDQNSLLVDNDKALTQLDNQKIYKKQLIIDNPDIKTITYTTPGPQKIEKQITQNKKEVTIVSQDHLFNVFSYTQIKETAQQNIHMYWIQNGQKTPFSDIAYVDTNNNGLIDRLEWITPHLSNQTFLIEFDILNLQSYPVVGGNWSVYFTTTGTANLTIETIDGTEWSKDSENKDLKFLELYCGQTPITYTWENNKIFVENFSCNETARETSKVISTGAHHIQFTFGNETKVANNWAYGDAFNQHGYIIGSGNILSDTITTVNQSQAFILFTAATSDATPDDNQFTPTFINDTEITFTRFDGSSTTSNLAYQIIQSADAKVQRGLENLGVGTAQVYSNIEDVDLTKAFIVVYGRCADETSGDNNAGFFRGTFINASRILLERGNEGDCAAAVSWQVVEWEGATVQSGNNSIYNNQYEVNVPINSVNTSETFVIFGSASIGTDQGMDSNLIRAELTNSTNIHFTHEPGTTYANATRDITWYAISIPGATVQTGAEALNGDRTTAISSVNLTRSFLWASGWNTGGGQTYSNSLYSLNISDATTLSWDKATGAQTQNVWWQVIELPGPIPDNIYPTFSNIIESPGTATYTPSATYTFNITIDNTNTTVGIEFNGINYTPTNTSNKYSFTKNDLPAGTYNYYWWTYANGRDNNFNTTLNQTYTISKANSITQLYLNDAQNNISIERTNYANINATRITGEKVIKLYNNGTLINEGTVLYNNTQFNEIGNHNITAIYEATQNYTQNIQTLWVNVSDTTKPNITNVQTGSITDVSALILWNTNEIANSTVEFGLTPLTLINISTTATWITSHNILLSGLSGTTTYHYKVTSCDPYGNCENSSIYNFTTLSEPDTTAPIIENITVTNIQENTATIQWDTGENANATINYGTTTNLGSTTIDTNYYKHQTVPLTNLQTLTLYYYNITACDPSNNCNTTGPYSFSTVDTTAPEWVNQSSNPPNNTIYAQGTDYQFNITWTDNIGIQNTKIEHNFTGVFKNESTTGNISNDYYFNISDLPAGTYQWRMHANDTSNNTNTTNWFTYTIQKIPSVITLYFNGSIQNLSINQTQNINVSAILSTPTQGEITIYEDGNSLTSGTTSTEIIKQYNQVGYYNITARYDGSENYSSQEATLWLTVKKPVKLYPTNTQAENGKIRLTANQEFVDLQNTYNLTKTFMIVNHFSHNGGNSVPSYSTPSAHFYNESRIQIDRYDNSQDATLSYSILQADNIQVWNFSKGWASAEESGYVNLDVNLPSDYDSKCFVETHRNFRLNSTDGSSFAEQEIRTRIENITSIYLERDTEGTNVADIGVQYGFVVCFLDETNIQTGTFSISGDANSESTITLNPEITNAKSFSVINYYQADDGVGQNALAPELRTTSSLIIHRDEAGGGQTALGRYYTIDFETEGEGNVEHVQYQAPGTGTLLTYTTPLSGVVNQSETLLSCEATMTAGGGVAHTRSQWGYTINSSNDVLIFEEGRDRSNNQWSDIFCDVIAWPKYTTYTKAKQNAVANASSLYHDTIIQKANSTLNITIFNDGYVGMDPIAISVQINGVEIDNREINISANNKTTYQIYHTFTQIGINNISIFSDYGELFDEINETDNNYTTTINVSAFHIYYGTTQNTVRVLGEGATLDYEFGNFDANGKIYVADADSNIDFSSLRGLGIRADSSWAQNDFYELDNKLNLHNVPDSIYNTWLKNNYSINQTDLVLYSYNVVNVSTINSTNTSNFYTGIVYDYSDDTGTEYDGEEDIIFVTQINQNKPGLYKVTDYEIKIPATLGEYTGSDDSVVFYYEIE